MVESRLKELKQECEELVEHSKRLQRDGQLLIEHFEAGMKRSQTLQMALERHLLSLRAKEEALLELRVDLDKYLKDD
jgi:DNA repair exonuclease SbcCD ATPase subunit